jgi:hypothetical protein
LRIALGLAALLCLTVIGLHEWSWRFDYTVEESFVSPAGSLVADVRNMPEASVVPYGTGVFIRPRIALSHRYQSHFVFAGYCRSLDVSWQSAKVLQLRCALPEKEPIVGTTELLGVKVEIAVDRVSRLDQNGSNP